MEWLIWIGAALSLMGLAGLVWCILAAIKARRAGLAGEAMRARLQTLVAYNLGAFLLSALGLMFVIVGIFLG
jgi:hypothetical protein